MASKQLEEIYRLVQAAPWRYTSTRDQVTLGRFFAIQGDDAREILAEDGKSQAASGAKAPRLLKAGPLSLR